MNLNAKLVFFVLVSMLLTINTAQSDEIASGGGEQVEVAFLPTQSWGDERFECFETSTDYVQNLRGNVREFVESCTDVDLPRSLCEGFTTPDPDSARMMRCAYGTQAVHLVGPEENWDKARRLGQIIMDVNAEVGEDVLCGVDDWFRPPRYNSYVLSSSPRHSDGGGVDVRTCGRNGQRRALQKLCPMLGGAIQGLGRYNSGAIHIDLIRSGTWGGPC